MPMVANHLHHLETGLFAIPNQEGIEKIGHGFRIEGIIAPTNHQGIFFSSILGVKRKSGQIQEGQDIGIGQFIRKGDAQDVKLAKGNLGFKRDQGEFLLAKKLLKIQPGGKNPFSEHVGVAIEEMIEDLNPDIAHPDLIGIWVTEGNFEIDVRPIFFYAILLISQITRGLANLGKGPIDRLPNRVKGIHRGPTIGIPPPGVKMDAQRISTHLWEEVSPATRRMDDFLTPKWSAKT